MPEPLLTLQDVSKRWGDILTLDRISLTVNEGEIVAILGPSGSGKSTLLRIITGLIAPTGGRVLYRGRPLAGPNPRAAMVFQNFALFPWLTVLENVELGLKAAGMALRERRARATRLIDLIGLDGFEDAYPKELSGGMRQRVGFARALAVEPEILCMDEPFSALDFLTAENLRTELLDLWCERKIPTRSILMVTHGIEEAVFMADRIIILDKNPATMVADLAIPLAQPRNRKAPQFIALVDRVYRIVTEGEGAEVEETAPVAAAPAAGAPLREVRLQRLPHANMGMMAGLLELVADRGGRDDLSRLGSELLLEVDDLLPVTDAADLLGFADVHEGDLVLSPLGQRFAEADVLERKRIFAEHIAELPVIALFRRVLAGKRSGTMPREFFLDVLEEQFGAEAEQQFNTAVNWGRYAELYYYDTASEEVYLERGEDEAGGGDGDDGTPPPGGASQPPEQVESTGRRTP